MSALASLVASGVVSENVPLGPYTTYKAGGPARYMIEVKDAGALQDLVDSGAAATFLSSSWDAAPTWWRPMPGSTVSWSVSGPVSRR